MTHCKTKLMIEKERDGFEVTCANCGSKSVAVETELFHSPADGMFGAAFLKCLNCNLTTVIWRSEREI